MGDRKKIPEVDDDIYVPSAYYLSHGVDDFEGGLCRIVKIECPEWSKGTPFVEVAERPGHSYNLDYLLGRQDELRERFGDKRGKEAPDYDPRFNEGF